MNWQKIGVITGAILGIVGCISLIVKIDARYAHADALKSVLQAVEANQLAIQSTNQQRARENLERKLDYLVKRSWELEDRIAEGKGDTSILKQQKREIEYEIERVKRSLAK